MTDKKTKKSTKKEDRDWMNSADLSFKTSELIGALWKYIFSKKGTNFNDVCSVENRKTNVSNGYTIQLIFIGTLIITIVLWLNL